MPLSSHLQESQPTSADIPAPPGKHPPPPSSPRESAPTPALDLPSHPAATHAAGVVRSSPLLPQKSAARSLPLPSVPTPRDAPAIRPAPALPSNPRHGRR